MPYLAALAPPHTLPSGLLRSLPYPLRFHRTHLSWLFRNRVPCIWCYLHHKCVSRIKLHVQPPPDNTLCRLLSYLGGCPPRCNAYGAIYADESTRWSGGERLTPPAIFIHVPATHPVCGVQAQVRKTRTHRTRSSYGLLTSHFFPGILLSYYHRASCC